MQRCKQINEKKKNVFLRAAGNIERKKKKRNVLLLTWTVILLSLDSSDILIPNTVWNNNIQTLFISRFTRIVFSRFTRCQQFNKRQLCHHRGAILSCDVRFFYNETKIVTSIFFCLLNGRSRHIFNHKLRSGKYY